mmetsp:Transcript_11173/g.19581  ORF Transcript_11173/g.19581 Transcript_11173/m.19581 type:complete len:623 (+) Transcript_11173:128-1996(+)
MPMLSCWHANALRILAYSCCFLPADLAVELSAEHGAEVLGTGALPVVKYAIPAAGTSSSHQHMNASTSRLQSRRAQLMRSTVPTSASFMRRSGSGSMSCDQVITKAMNMVGAYKELAIAESNATFSDRDLDGDIWVRYVEDKLHADPPEVGVDVLGAFYQVLNRITLSDGLINGNVWTIAHAEALFSCFGFDGSLEMHNATITNRSLCGGDLVCREVENEHSEGLLQAQHRPEPWVRYPWALAGNCTDNFTSHHKETGDQIAASNLGTDADADADGDAPSENVTGCHEVSYCVAGHVKLTTKAAFVLATERIRRQVPCIAFKEIEWEGGDDCVSVPSVIVQSKNGGCWSHAGQVSGRLPEYIKKSQAVNLDTGCEAVGLVIHQLCHTLGLLHEMYRGDRDKFVHMQTQNLIPEKFISGTFTSVREVADDSGNNGFDFLSIMMYSSDTFSKNGAMVVRPRDLRVKSFMGQRMGLSELDARALGELYECPDQVVSLSGDKWLSEALRTASDVSSVSGDQATPDENYTRCKDERGTDFFSQNETEYRCRDLKEHCGHESLGTSLRIKCPLTCHACVPCMWPEMRDDACNYLWVPPRVKHVQSGANHVRALQLILAICSGVFLTFA